MGNGDLGLARVGSQVLTAANDDALSIADVGTSHPVTTKEELLSILRSPAETADWACLHPVVGELLAASPRDVELIAAQLIIESELGYDLDLGAITKITGPLVANHVLLTGRLHAARRVARALYKDKDISTLETMWLALAKCPVKPPVLRNFRDEVGNEFLLSRNPTGRRGVMFVCFCGNGEMMMVQLNAIHPWLARQAKVVVYLRDLSRMLYMNGIKSVGNVEAVIEALKTVARENDISRIVCFGTSGGSFGALHYAPKLDAKHVLCFAGATHLPLAMSVHGRKLHATVTGKLEERGIEVPDLRDVYADRMDMTIRMIYAADSEFDSQQAEHLEGLPCVRLRPLRNYSRHNVLTALLRRNLLERELAYAATGRLGPRV